MRIFTSDPALIESGAVYLRAVSLSYLLCGISQIYLILLKNTGYATVSSRISCTAVVVNIICNAILIYGLLGLPALGIQGAAYATVAAPSGGAHLELPGDEAVRACADHLEENVPCGGCRSDKRFLALYHAGARRGACLGNRLCVLLCDYGTYGSDAVAANSITTIAKNMLSCLIRGVSGGAGVLIGNLLGAGELDKAKVYGGRLTRMAIVVGMTTGGLLMLISPLIVRFAPLSETAAEYLQYMLIFCGCNIMAQSVNTTVLDGIFCAGGDSKFDMKGNLGAMWCFSVPFGFFAAFVLKWPVMVVYCIVISTRL